MPQISVNSSNINQFGFSALFDPLAKTIIFDIGTLTTYNNVSNSGFLYVLGVAFSVVDQDGVTLASVDWGAPQIEPALSETEYVLDLSDVGIDFFFQTYKIIGYIKDSDGVVYSTTQVNKKVCQPVDITSDGYVPGIFQVTSNCIDNIITVKEVTKLVYNGIEPTTTIKSGTLTYPSGTISAVSFTGTPFTNDVIYTGQYRVACTTISNYDLGDDMTIDVSYITNNIFEITCANKVQDILCCLVALQKTKTENCNNAIGQRAAQQLSDIEIPFFIAIAKEFSGQDASTSVDYIKKKLSCNCGSSSIIQNEFTPINPSVTNIVLNGVGGTSIGSPNINGNTKTYNIQSSVYQVVKGDTGDDSFTITLNTNTANTVKYIITFDYNKLATNILNEIGGNTTLLTLFNSLVDITDFKVDLTNLNGGCIIDLSSINYFLSLKVPSAASTIVSILINGTTYTAGSPILVNNPVAIELWLNALGLGTFDVSFSTGTSGSYVNILTVGNGSTITSSVFNTGTNITVLFQKTNKSLIAFLQAVTDYICDLSAVNILLGQEVTVCYLDYNGNNVSTTYTATETQNVLNEAFASALCYAVGNINRTFNNALTPIGTTVQWGGTLIQDTVITQNGKYIVFQGDDNNSLTLDTDNFFLFNKQGSGGSDVVNALFTRYNLFVSQVSTNADRAAISYYAKANIAIQNNDGIDQSAVIGTYYPTTNDNTFPAPPNDLDKTAFLKTIYDVVTGFGSLELYAKTHTHTGEVSNFDSLLRLNRKTTAEITAIDAGLLTGGLLVYNTTTNKAQVYNGSAWQDLN